MRHAIAHFAVSVPPNARPGNAMGALGKYGSAMTSPESVADRRICPACSGTLLQIARLPLDRFASLLVPVARYRCREHGCRWEGTLRAENSVASRDTGP